MADFEVTFNIQQPSIEAEFEVECQEIEATFELQAASEYLSQLQDVSITTTPTQGQHLSYDETLKKWTNNNTAATWGSIGGYIENQEDLQEALSSKQGSLTPGSNIDITDNVIKTKTYIHEQGVASDEWIITHNLGKFPAVVVIDSAQSEVTAEIVYIDENTCKVKMNASFKGKAFLN